ncbi:MAG: F0F1 ATP synthase subunit B [Propionibacteriales bacterium]|nr:F0F1 ATP synthase subunit B [Propionibacteriales bacterium]
MALVPHNFSEVVMGILLVCIIWFVIAKFVAPKFEAAYQERRSAIEGGMERAELAQQKAEAALERYEAQLADARAEAATIREDAKNQGAQILSEMREQANAESARLVANAKTQIDAERTKVLGQLRTEVGGMATTLAGRIVGESLDDDERARRTVDRFIADLETTATPEPSGRS